VFAQVVSRPKHVNEAAPRWSWSHGSGRGSEPPTRLERKDAPYDYPRDLRWRAWLPPVAMVGVLLFTHSWSFFKGRAAFSLSVFVLEILLLWYLTRPLRMFAQRVITYESGIEVIFFSGMRTRLAWQDIRRVRDFSARTFEGRTRFIRLIPRSWRKRVIITDGMNRFQDLYEQIRRKAPQADYRDTPSLPDRLLY